jgi:hypothetical protein
MGGEEITSVGFGYLGTEMPAIRFQKECRGNGSQPNCDKKGEETVRRRCHAAGQVILPVGLILVALLLASCGSRPAATRVEVPRITVEEARQRMVEGEPITFVDSRSASAWESAVGKIPGAVRVPPDQATQRISAIPKGNPVVVYCT